MQDRAVRIDLTSPRIRAIAYGPVEANLGRGYALNPARIRPEPPESTTVKLKWWLGNSYAIALSRMCGTAVSVTAKRQR